MFIVVLRIMVFKRFLKFIFREWQREEEREWQRETNINVREKH